MGQTRTKVVETAIDPEKQRKIEELGKKSPETAEIKEKQKKTKPQKVRSKRYKQSLTLIDNSKIYPMGEAIETIKKTADTKFDSSIEAHINLGFSADKADHQIRTLVSLPHKTGKVAKLLVFTNKNKEEIKKLGAEIGTETTLKEIEKGKVEFDNLSGARITKLEEIDKIIADSAWMPALAKVAKVLGPKGLMPNPKSGTVTDDPLSAVKEFSSGKVELKSEKSPIIHVQIGNSSFKENQLQENLTSIISAIYSARPEGFKKELIKTIYLSSTMGPSIKVETSIGPDA